LGGKGPTRKQNARNLSISLTMIPEGITQSDVGSNSVRFTAQRLNYEVDVCLRGDSLEIIVRVHGLTHSQRENISSAALRKDLIPKRQ